MTMINENKYEPNNIYCVDCYEAIKALPDKSIDLVYTDIPYLYPFGGCGHSELGQRLKKQNNEISFISNGIDYAILDEFKRVCKKVNIFIWCSKMQLNDILTWGRAYNTEVLVWCKQNPTPTCNNKWLPDIEYCVYIRESGVRLNDGYDLKHKWYCSKANVTDKGRFEHPTIKPLAFVQAHIQHTTQEGDIVLDTFCGSGTTCVACKNTNRQYIGFEIEPKWAEIASNRLNNVDANGQMSLFTI